MSWIVNNREEAEAAGADLEGMEVMFAITPNWVGETFNRHHNSEAGVDESDDDFRDYWEEIGPERRKEYIEGIERYIDKRLSHTWEDVIDVIRSFGHPLPERTG